MLRDLAIFSVGGIAGFGLAAAISGKRFLDLCDLLEALRELLAQRKPHETIMAFLDRHAPEARSD